MQKSKNNSIKLMKYSILLFFICWHNLVYSQVSVDTYLETGSTNVSAGLFGNFSTQISALFGSFSVSTGGLLNFSNANTSVFSAYSIQAANEFKILNLPVNIAALYLWKPFSADLRESDFGLLAKFRTKHWGYQLGINSRIYYFTNSARQKYNFADSVATSIWEPFNLMYRLSYYQSLGKKWDFEACVTNFDRYIIEQETNPLLQAKFSYKLNDKLLFYSDLGYMQAGLLNMRVNTFGLFLRGAVLWKIN